MITAGVDIGSVGAKAVIWEGEENRIISQAIMRTGADSAGTAQKVMRAVLDESGLTLEDIQFIVGTGYGRVNVPFAQKHITEISCHARGAYCYFPSVRTVLDMGGQDCKAIRVDEKGKVANFVMNDKCAAGAGRSMEVMAKLLDVPLEQVGELSLNIVKEPAKISGTCVLFARGEVLALRRKGMAKNDILAGACDSLVKRVHTLLKRVGIENDLVISGGIAKNIGIVERVQQITGYKAHICSMPETIGALGAALFAQDFAKRKRG